MTPVSAKAVVLRGGSVLLGRNDRGEDELPGGRLEPGERAEDAVVREVGEEAGLRVRVVRPLAEPPFEVLPGRAVLLAGFLCAEVDGPRVPVRSEEHAVMRFVPLAELDALPLPEPYRRFIRAAAPAGRP